MTKGVIKVKSYSFLNVLFGILAVVLSIAMVFVEGKIVFCRDDILMAYLHHPILGCAFFASVLLMAFDFDSIANKKKVK